MIELKDVTAGKEKDGNPPLKDFSIIFRDGDIMRFDRSKGELIINVILGFCPVAEGYVCFDGMILNERSAPFMRKLAAYIPTPDGFRNVPDPAKKQSDMIDEALQSDAGIILAVDPFSRLSGEKARETIASFRRKAAQGAIVVIATDNIDLQ